MKPWAQDIGYDGPPFFFDPERRALLRAELDTYYAHPYGLTLDELRYILDPADVMGPDYPSETFRVLKNNEIRQFGEYRTQRLVLEAWDRLFGGGCWVAALSRVTAEAKHRMNSQLDRITMNPAVCHGKPTIRGLRYPVDVVLDLLAAGMSVAEILADYPDLEAADISAVLSYAAQLSRVQSVELLSA